MAMIHPQAVPQAEVIGRYSGLLSASEPVLLGPPMPLAKVHRDYWRSCCYQRAEIEGSLRRRSSLSFAPELIPTGPASSAVIQPQAVSQAEVVSLLRRSSVSEPTLPRRTLLVSLLL